MVREELRADKKVSKILFIEETNCKELTNLTKWGHIVQADNSVESFIQFLKNGVIRRFSTHS